jgi:hypothetical protein
MGDQMLAQFLRMKQCSIEPHLQSENFVFAKSDVL